MDTRGTIGGDLSTYALGRHQWNLTNEAHSCSGGKPWLVDLKLTGCDQEGEFTCDDGQCVRMEQRCDQLVQCRDKSDEENCQLLVLESSYKKSVPPITAVSLTDSTIVPVPVTVNIVLMKVVSIEEAKHKIEFAFEISLEWTEIRATYLNLKKDTAMNSLSEGEYGQLWLPLVIFSNTDQKETTRLGTLWEWSSSVTVTREGRATMAGLEQLHETEFFRGSENRLTMNQTYTKEFQCSYNLVRYPFDTQVTFVYNVFLRLLFFSF